MLIHRRSMAVGTIMVALVLAACAPGDSQAATQQRGAAALSIPAPSARAALQLVVAPAGNEVRYLVREQLVGVDLPASPTAFVSSTTSP